jgi:hypothetical protein
MIRLRSLRRCRAWFRRWRDRQSVQFYGWWERTFRRRDHKVSGRWLHQFKQDAESEQVW